MERMFHRGLEEMISLDIRLENINKEIKITSL